MGIVIMETLSLQHHLRIMLDHIEEASRELRIPVDIDRAALVMIARSAVNGNRGEDWTKRRIDAMIGQMLREDPGAERLVYRFEPPDADEKRQSASEE